VFTVRAVRNMRTYASALTVDWTLFRLLCFSQSSRFSLRRSLCGKIAENYSKLLSNGKADVVVPRIPSGYSSVWAQYSVLAKDENHRSELQSKLKEAGIPTAIYYSKPLHLQTAFLSLGYKPGDFPVSEDAARRIFNIPMHPYLTSKDQERIAKVLAEK
jgi:dTDP-4-amino-4,6-dideoxygalactose transaminase